MVIERAIVLGQVVLICPIKGPWQGFFRRHVLGQVLLIAQQNGNPVTPLTPIVLEHGC